MKRIDELDQPISTEEVLLAIRSLSRNKANSVDFLLNEYFIETGDIIANHISDIFNMVYDSGHFPEMWTTGIIIRCTKKAALAKRIITGELR